MKNLATLLLLVGAISSVVTRPAPLSNQPQHVDWNAVKEVSADLAPDYAWIADLNATQTSDEEGPSAPDPQSAALVRRINLEGWCEKTLYKWPGVAMVVARWECDALPDYEACLPKHRSQKPEATLREEWFEETRAQQKEDCKDEPCREEVDRIYDRIRDEALAKPEPDWGKAGHYKDLVDKPDEEVDVYWPCGREPPFHLPGHPSRPFTFESCADGSCGPPIKGNYEADASPPI